MKKKNHFWINEDPLEDLKNLQKFLLSTMANDKTYKQSTIIND